MKNRVGAIILVLLAAASLAAGCVKMGGFPGRFGYKLHVSQDVLDLFDVEARYKELSGEEKVRKMNNTDWETTYYQEEGFTAEMVVTMKAKKGAVDGTSLKKEEYEMEVLPEIFEPEVKPMPKLTLAPSDYTVFTFRVPRSGGEMSARVAPLKYDKHFVFAYSVDDSYENGWSKIYSLFNGRWIDDQEFCHIYSPRTSGSRSNPLCVTDGCGNDRRFTFGESLWANCWNASNKDGFIQDEIVSVYNPYVSWQELRRMTNMGNAVYYHNVDSTQWGQKDPELLAQGLEQDYDKVMEKINYPMRSLAQPDGNPHYLEAAEISPLIYVTRTLVDAQDIRLNSCESLFKSFVFGGVDTMNADDKLAELARQAASSDPSLVSMLVHRPDAKQLAMFERIYELYGKRGADNILVTSYDDLYDYFEMRREAVITSRVQGDYILFEVSVPNDEKRMYKELTIIIDGADKPAEYPSDELLGFESVRRKDGSVIVNCNFDDRLPEKINSVISDYGESFEQDDKSDAMYLISLLRQDLQQPYLDKLNVIREPTKEDVPLNGKYDKKLARRYVGFYDGEVISVSKTY